MSNVIGHRFNAPRHRVALLVLAYRAPITLETFSRTFDDDRFVFFVHLDSKVDTLNYQYGRRWPDRFSFIADRHPIFWGGFNMVRATESLAKAALADQTINSFALISDDTLPLRSPAQIYQELTSRPERIDVGLYRKNPTFLKRYTDFFFMDSSATSVRAVELCDRQIDDVVLEAFGRLIKLKKRGKFPLEEVWGGAQWWSMSRPTLQAVLDELSSNSWLRESLEFSAVPDEIAFQTVYARLKGFTSRSFTSPMLTDMDRQPRPFVFSQADELPQYSSEKLFVRKVADIKAPSVMEQIAASWGDVNDD